jgi:intein/homing endonuclease
MSYLHINNLYKDREILLFKECYAMEKIHGCLEESTLVETKDGVKTIKEICESEYSGNIKSYDFTSHKSCWKKITNHFINDEVEDWFEFELEDGEKLKLTGNHLVWLPNLACFRRADQLKADDVVLLL